MDSRMYVIAGAKGGVGKSFIASNIAAIIAGWNKQVVVADTLSGPSSMHNLLGVPFPEKTLGEYVADDSTNLDSLLVNSSNSAVRMLSSASKSSMYKEPSQALKKKYLKDLKKINCQYLILDLPTDFSAEAVEAFLNANQQLLVIDALSPTIESSFMFLKRAVFQIVTRPFKKNKEVYRFIEQAFNPRDVLKLETVHEILKSLDQIDAGSTNKARQGLKELSPKLVLNRAEKDSDVEVVMPFQKLVSKYLDVDVEFLGKLQSDNNVSNSMVRGIPVSIDHPTSKISGDLNNITEKFIS